MRDRRRSSERETDFHLFVLQWRDRLGLDQRLVGRDALAPRRDCALPVVTLEVLPVGNDEVGIPLVEIVDSGLMEQLHAEAGSLVFVVVKNLHERFAVSRILERPQLFRERRGDPLDAVPEEMKQNEALHFEIHVWIESESQAIKNTRTRRLKVTIFDRETIFTIFEVIRSQIFTSGCEGITPTRRWPTSSCPAICAAFRWPLIVSVSTMRPTLPAGEDCNKAGVARCFVALQLP